MDNFDEQLDAAYEKKVIGRLITTVKAVAIVIDSQLVITTPVDTGRARSNWLPSLNEPDVSIIPSLKKTKGRVKGAGEIKRKVDVTSVLSSFKITDTILISNNLPYIKKLNDGSSKQAPAGFVEAAIEVGKRAVK